MIMGDRPVNVDSKEKKKEAEVCVTAHTTTTRAHVHIHTQHNVYISTSMPIRHNPHTIVVYVIFGFTRVH